MNTHEFEPSRDTIESTVEIGIAAPPEVVAGLYRDVENWSHLFPASIVSARITATEANWKEIEVQNRLEGRITGTMIDVSPTEIRLIERKSNFDVMHLIKFLPAEHGRTQLVIHAYVTPKGVFKLLRPFVASYPQGQTTRRLKYYVLAPLKMAAEKKRS